MDMYSPLFSKIVDSSLWREEDWVIKIFLTMIAKQDKDHVVRGSAFNIGEWAKKDEATALAALKVLAAPDTKRIEPQPFEGRRIERVEDGWLILRGAFYQDLMREVNRRRYKADHEAKRRAEEKANGKPKRLSRAMGKMSEGGPSPRETAYVKAVERGDQAEADRLALPVRTAEEDSGKGMALQ